MVHPRDLRTFLTVARLRSFRAAADELDVPSPTVSRQVARLELELGVRLLHRSTRSVAITTAGQEVAKRAEDALRALDLVARSAEVAVGVPRGHLRIAAPPMMGPLLAGKIVESMLQAYPALSIEMALVDRRVDVLGEGFDVALRMGPVLDERLVARRLGEVELWVVDHKPCRHPSELDEQILAYRSGIIEMSQGSSNCSIRTHTRLRVNDYGMLFSAASQGLGAAVLPHPMCHPSRLERAGLQRVLSDWFLSAEPVHLLRPSGRVATPRVAAFIQRLESRATQEDWPLRRRATNSGDNPGNTPRRSNDARRATSSGDNSGDNPGNTPRRSNDARRATSSGDNP